MKNLIFTLFVVLVLFSCSDNNDEPTTQNYFNVNGTKYEIKTAAAETNHWISGGTERTTYHFFFIDKEINPADVVHASADNINADWQGLSIIEFNFDKDYDNFDYNVIGNNCFADDDNYPANIGVGLNITAMSYDNELELETGSFCAEKISNTFTISFTGTTNNGQPVELNYNGTLYEFETTD